MNLVLRRAVQHMLDYRSERKPDMTVPQVCRQRIEDEHHVGHTKQCVAADLPATGIPEDTGEGADENDVNQPPDYYLAEMHATGRHRNQHRRRMMNLVKRPQITGMKGTMYPVMNAVL